MKSFILQYFEGTLEIGKVLHDKKIESVSQGFLGVYWQAPVLLDLSGLDHSLLSRRKELDGNPIGFNPILSRGINIDKKYRWMVSRREATSAQFWDFHQNNLFAQWTKG